MQRNTQAYQNPKNSGFENKILPISKTKEGICLWGFIFSRRILSGQWTLNSLKVGFGVFWEYDLCSTLGTCIIDRLVTEIPAFIDRSGKIVY